MKKILANLSEEKNIYMEENKNMHAELLEVGALLSKVMESQGQE